MAQEAFQRPPTAQLAVLAELRRRIVRAELEPGTSIRQEALARELGVSRLPVREALMVLRAEQLVDYVQHKGYVASALDIDDLNQTYHLREILETEAVKQAMPNLTDEHIDEMRESMRSMERRQGDSVGDLLDENRSSTSYSSRQATTLVSIPCYVSSGIPAIATALCTTQNLQILPAS